MRGTRVGTILCAPQRQDVAAKIQIFPTRPSALGLFILPSFGRRLHQMGVRVAPDGREGCTRWAERLHQMGAKVASDGRAFPPISPPLPHLWRVFSDTTPQKLRRLPKNLPRFSENLQRNFEKVQRFPKKLRRIFENLPRFCPTCAAIFLLSLPQLKINH